MVEQSGARELLEAGLQELRWDASSQQISSLARLAELLATWTQRINLTGHRGAREIAHRLILDAAALAAELPELPSLADIGSGAGFPGLPIAILREDCRVTLIESRQRRHHFQRTAIRELGIGNARALHGRAEELSPEPHAASAAQAVAAPADALQLMLPWTEPGGQLLLPGSEVPVEPPEDAQVRFDRCISYRVPCDGPRRTLWVAVRR